MSDSQPRAEPVIETLAGLGVEADETDKAVIAGVLSIFVPGVQALLETDLSAVEPEVDCDPSRPPPS